MINMIKVLRLYGGVYLEALAIDNESVLIDINAIDYIKSTPDEHTLVYVNFREEPIMLKSYYYDVVEILQKESERDEESEDDIGW